MRTSPPPASALLSLAGLLVGTASATATDVPIYGGPTYNTATNTGFHVSASNDIPRPTVGNGLALGPARRMTNNVNRGMRAVRWDTSGAPATELGNLGLIGVGSTSAADSYPTAVNTAGTAVGFAEKAVVGVFRGTRAVRWDASGTAATELDSLGTDANGITTAAAVAINTGGASAGWADKYISGVNLGPRAIRWAATGTAATELGHLGTDANGFTTAQARGLNSAGTAVGVAEKYVAGVSYSFRAVRWDAAGTAATELGHLGADSNGYTQSSASAINASGTTIGSAFKFDGDNMIGQRAVRWEASSTTTTELGNLGTDANGATGTVAAALNASGTVVGSAGKYVGGVDFGTRAVRWNAVGTAATELGMLGTDPAGRTNCVAHSINAAGTAVGFAELYDSAGEFLGQRAVIWRQDGAAVTLNSMLSPADAARWTLTDARAISDTNWVTGIGSYDPDGPGSLPAYDRLFLMQIPAPACPADFDHNGIIQPADVGAFVTHWFAALTSGC